MTVREWLRPGPKQPAHPITRTDWKSTRAGRAEGLAPSTLPSSVTSTGPNTSTDEVPRRRTAYVSRGPADVIRFAISSILLAFAAIIFGWAYETSLSGSVADLSIEGAWDGYRRLIERITP